MKTLPIDDHNKGDFFHKLGNFYSIFEKGQGRAPPHPPLVTRLPYDKLYAIICEGLWIYVWFFTETIIYL